MQGKVHWWWRFPPLGTSAGDGGEGRGGVGDNRERCYMYICTYVLTYVQHPVIYHMHSVLKFAVGIISACMYVPIRTYM